MELSLLGLLYGLASVVFTAMARRPTDLIWWLLGVIAGVLVLQPAWLDFPVLPILQVDGGQMALLLLLLSIVLMQHNRYAMLALWWAGLVSVNWGLVLQLQGYPLIFIFLLVVTANLVSALSALMHKGFVSDQLQEEALLWVISLALVMVVIPPAITGWQSASSLKTIGESGASGIAGEIGAGYIAWLPLVFMVSGGVYAAWRLSRAKGSRSR